MIPFYTGFLLGFSLIAVIGAQNAFVLKQGLVGEHVLAVCLVCAVSDAVLIAGGVYGFHLAVARLAWIEAAARVGGAVFLLGYGARSFYLAAKSGGALRASGNRAGSLGLAVATCAALTWLNPHVYLDTVVLLGSVSAQYPDPGGKMRFAAGASLASLTFFLSLGFGAKRLRPWFQKPAAWRMLDFAVGAVMWVIAAGLLINR